uniref:Secreted protein n=1 Tax=Ditylenchus dipsaci TaxID=166011 RepID=A0A915EN90_9BILA
MLCLFMNTFLTGYFAVTGAVYCSHPTFIYFFGSFGLVCWACESTAEVVLALNRCVAICSPKWKTTF